MATERRSVGGRHSQSVALHSSFISCLSAARLAAAGCLLSLERHRRRVSIAVGRDGSGSEERRLRHVAPITLCRARVVPRFWHRETRARLTCFAFGREKKFERVSALIGRKTSRARKTIECMLACSLIASPIASALALPFDLISGACLVKAPLALVDAPISLRLKLSRRRRRRRVAWQTRRRRRQKQARSTTRWRCVCVRARRLNNASQALLV